MIVTIFRSRLRDEARDEYTVSADEIDDLAAHQPGFISAKTFTASDGERVTLAEFATDEDVRSWRSHQRHREAQMRGRSDFYSEYHIQVCSVARAYSFVGEEDAKP